MGGGRPTLPQFLPLARPVANSYSVKRHPRAPTLGRLGAGAHALVHAVQLLALHADVLQPPVVRVDAVLQQLAQGHRAGGEGREPHSASTRSPPAQCAPREARSWFPVGRSGLGPGRDFAPRPARSRSCAAQFQQGGPTADEGRGMPRTRATEPGFPRTRQWLGQARDRPRSVRQRRHDSRGAVLWDSWVAAILVTHRSATKGQGAENARQNS